MQKVIWKIEYNSGLIVYEDTVTTYGDGGWEECTKKGDIKSISFLTPVGEFYVNIQNGEILGNSVYATDNKTGQQIDLTHKDIIYQPYQRKVGIFHDNIGQSLAFYKIGWIADFEEYKVNAYLLIDANTFQFYPYVEEIESS